MVPVNAPTVQIKSVSKQFGEGPVVLDKIHLEAMPGEFISLVGPSGCGKSTLLRMLAGLSKPSAGNILINGKGVEESECERAFIFQEATLLPWLSVRSNIEVPLNLRGANRQSRTETATRLAEWVGLGEYLNYYPRQLSGGMQMRVSLARALSLSPSILLLDEPFGALDAMTRNRLNEDLLGLRERQAWTAFFVTHSISEAVFLSNKVVILSTQPAGIVDTIEVPFDYPRTAQLRQTLEFQKLVAEASARLHTVLR
jgi:NitT/TauT family transport system ATP-binding protein